MAPHAHGDTQQSSEIFTTLGSAMEKLTDKEKAAEIKKVMSILLSLDFD